MAFKSFAKRKVSRWVWKYNVLKRMRLVNGFRKRPLTVVIVWIRCVVGESQWSGLEKQCLNFLLSLHFGRRLFQDMHIAQCTRLAVLLSKYILVSIYNIYLSYNTQFCNVYIALCDTNKRKNVYFKIFDRLTVKWYREVYKKVPETHECL